MADRNKKGKLSRNHKYVSIMLIPPFTGKSKVFRFSLFYRSFLAGIIASVLVLFCVGFFIYYEMNAISQLKTTNTILSNMNDQQRDLLNEKISENEDLKRKEDEIDGKIQEFSEKYREITDNYLNSRSDGARISRSDDRNDRTFIEDVSQLKDILDQLSSSDGVPEPKSKAEDEDAIKNYEDTVPTLWPLKGRITSAFGDRLHPIFNNVKTHTGIDIAASYGQDVLAAASGKVVFTGYYSDYGYMVIIDHGRGITTLYAHLSKFIIMRDQYVKKGELIAKAGSTGNSTGPHLHFEVRIDDNPVDPIQYLDKQ